MVDSNATANSIHINDYVEFYCKLKRNPYIENMINAINLLEVEGTLNESKDEISIDEFSNQTKSSGIIKREELLNYLKKFIFSQAGKMH